MKNPPQSRSYMGPGRFIVYIVFLFLAYQFVHTFLISPPKSPEPVAVEETNVDPPALPIVDPALPHKSTLTLLDPLDPSNVALHPPAIKLSIQERLRLETLAINNARQEAEAALKIFNLTGIPGSVLTTTEQVRRLHARLECFTSTPETGGGAGWVYNNAPRPLTRHLQEPVYSRCDKRYAAAHKEDDGSGWNVREAVKYVWTAPPECPLKPVDRADWCNMIRGRHIILVGDSLTFQLHEMWVDVFRDGPVVCFGELNCKDHTICSPPNHKDARVRYLRNDLVSAVTKNHEISKGHPSVRIVQLPWIVQNKLAYYGIAIINRQPTLIPDSEFTEELIKTVQAIRRDYPTVLLFYRNTPVGHLGCDVPGLEPLTRQPTELELQELPYHWGEAKRQNAMAKEIIEAAGGVYIDVATMTNLRPDGHIGGQDCLRYCIPGPLDAWMLILYNAFRILSGSDEV